MRRELLSETSPAQPWWNRPRTRWFYRSVPAIAALLAAQGVAAEPLAVRCTYSDPSTAAEVYEIDGKEIVVNGTRLSAVKDVAVTDRYITWTSAYDLGVVKFTIDSRIDRSTGELVHTKWVEGKASKSEGKCEKVDKPTTKF